ncbi:MAG: FecR domain-containing protein [Bacteroidales bacterium]|nr:FecR domain-containing protein [Bacteroidales bacterium]
MDKNLILKYVNKTASEQEKAKVLKWAAESMENEKKLVEMMNVWVADHMPQDKADDEKFQEFGYYLRGYNASVAKNRQNRIMKVTGWCSAAAVIIALLTWNIFLTHSAADNNPASPDSSSIAQVTETAQDIRADIPVRTLYTNKGVKACITLPDSSVVWLNSDTRIEYPEVFSGKAREVKLSGEAYFDVKKNPEWPMVITTNKGFQVKVTGTSFNIKAYDNDEVAKTTLYSGSISLLYKNRHNATVEKSLKPNQSVDLVDGKAYTNTNATPDQMEAASLWKMGKIHFDSTPVSEAIKILNRWHGTHFIVKNPEILDYQITGNFENESIVQILELIKLTSYIDYTIEGKNIILTKR